VNTAAAELELIIKERYNLTTVKMEHLRSSSFYEIALDSVQLGQWGQLETLLRHIQIIRTRNDRRPTA
jgi:hypothetical protein